LKERWKQPGNLPVEQEIVETQLSEGENTEEELDEVEDELEEI
jgi:hypothetical protein